jgi:hypothetical protein
MSKYEISFDISEMSEVDLNQLIIGLVKANRDVYLSDCKKICFGVYDDECIKIKEN